MKSPHIQTPEPRVHYFPQNLKARCIERMNAVSRAQIAVLGSERANQDLLGLLVAGGHAKGIVSKP